MSYNNFDDYLGDDFDLITASSCTATPESYSGKSYIPKPPTAISEMKFSELQKFDEALNDLLFGNVKEIYDFRKKTVVEETERRRLKEHPLIGKYFSMKIDYSHKYVFRVVNIYNLWDAYDHHWLICEDQKATDVYQKKNFITDYDIKYLLEISGYFINDSRIVHYATIASHDFQFGTTSLFGASDKFQIVYHPYKLTNLLSHDEWWEDKDAKVEIKEITEADFNNIEQTFKFINNI